MTAPDAGPSQLFAERLVESPQLMSPENANAAVEAWLEDIPGEQRFLFNDLFTRHPLARTLIAGIAEASPFLFDLIRSNPAYLQSLLWGDPDQLFDDCVARTRRVVADSDSEAGVMQALRRMKAESALLIALADIGGIWPLMRVTAALTQIADVSVQLAVRHLLNQEVKRGRITPVDPAHPERSSGLIVLAMGKMGAFELNYSSDIDLIVFFDAAVATLNPNVEATPFFVRIAQGLSRLLQTRTSDGYVFRVDLRLRPDPSSTQAAISRAAALHYYEREGRTWERAAMIKARACAGDLAAGEALLDDIAPFVWRKHLDFAAVADVHDMKRQMHAFKGHSEVMVEGHNVKLGRGGIREVEFFAQTQQLIAGGRHPELRERRTLDTLDHLASSNWITYQARDELHQAYLFLRRVEHRLQMVADEQTHTLPETREEMERFARFLGFSDRDAFASELLGHLNRVQDHYGRLFEAQESSSSVDVIDYSKGPQDQHLLEHLLSLGFKKPAMVAESMQQWLGGSYRALKDDATRRNFADIVPALIARLAKSENPDIAVVQFDRFLQSLQRGARLVALLQQNPQLVSLLALVLGAAPRLSDMLAQQPQIMDGLIDPGFFGTMPRLDDISQRLSTLLSDAQSYEDLLDRVRLFGQENLFLIGVRILSGTVSAQLAGTAFADVAEGIVRTVHQVVLDQFVRQYGRIKDQETVIVALGKLGGREMTASSDLDLIVLYDFDSENPDSDGERPLQGAHYFARLTQRLISAFTTRTNYGVLYDVDMRLRPSGRAGPVATSLAAFEHYQTNEAWTWEHMALTRARAISGPPDLCARVNAIIADVLCRPRDTRMIASDVAEMRRAIAQEKGESDIWDIKYAAGGIVDIEFIAQYLQLVHAATLPDILASGTSQVLDNALRLGVLSSVDMEVLRPAVRLYHDLTQILRLCVSSDFKPETAGADLLQALARAADEPEFSALEARLRDTQTEVRRVFTRLIDDAGN